MLWLNKVRDNAKDIVREHPASIVSVLFFVVCYALLEDIIGYSDKSYRRSVFEFIQVLSLGMTFGFLLCESNYSYRRHMGKLRSIREIKKSFVYIIAVIVSFAFSCINGYKSVFLKQDNTYFYDIFNRFFWVYLAAGAIGSLYYMYKRTDETFEKYCVKAFLGCLKGILVYGVISVGTLCILAVFNTLIMNFDYFLAVEMIIAGVIGYPAMLVGLTKMGDKITHFSRIMVGYVFTGILAVATTIVYAYIVKIIFTRTFPSNEAYSIMTSLFAVGIVVWTMAHGCTEGRMQTIVSFLPMLYSPFIIVQCMCLFLRIGQYGITAKRYFGIVFVIFEITYLIYYFIRMKRHESIGGFLFPFVLMIVIVCQLVPGINVYAAITQSQKGKVTSYIREISKGSEPSGKDKNNAASAYVQIYIDGNVEGKIFINRLKEDYPELDIDELLGYVSDRVYDYDEITAEKSIYAYDNLEELDISGYDHMAVISIYRSADEGNIDVTKFELEAGEGDNYHNFGTVDFSNLVKELESTYDEGGSPEAFTKIIRKYFAISDDGKLGSSFDDAKGALYLENVSLDIKNDGSVTYLSLEGYYLYKD